MKQLLKIHLLTTLLFFSILSLHATTITWLGGSGAWDNATLWDTGTIPAAGDDVIIPSGYVRIYNGDYETATSVTVQSAARLYIYSGGNLEISGAINNDGLHNLGRIYIWGNLAINSISQTNTAFSANAIKNDNRIYTYSNSYINIKYIDDIAIENGTYSYFRNRGLLNIHQIENTGILNLDRFYNSGTVSVSHSSFSTGFLIANADDFRNLTDGEIDLDADIYGGFSNNASPANFRNYGNINVENVDIAINVDGIVTNYSSGTIDIYDTQQTGIWIREDGTITNHGGIDIYYSESGIINYGNLINENSIAIFYTSFNASIINHPTGVIKNYDDLYLLSNGYRDITNHGTIFNYNGAQLAFNKILDMTSGSSLANYGFVVTYGSDPHVNNGSFGNKGVIDDNHGQLQGVVANDRLIVAPVSGPMQVGVPYPNVLDVASLDGISIGNWKVSQNGASAGTYNETTNEFTPNSSAIGLTTIYISIEDLTSGVSRNFSLEIDSPILPFTRNSSSAARSDLDEGSSFDHDIVAFPNPTSGQVNLESRIFENLPTQVYIYNNMGQMVQVEKLNEGQSNHSFNFNDKLTNGLYILKIIQGKKEIEVKRIQLFK